MKIIFLLVVFIWTNNGSFLLFTSVGRDIGLACRVSVCGWVRQCIRGFIDGSGVFAVLIGAMAAQKTLAVALTVLPVQGFIFIIVIFVGCVVVGGYIHETEVDFGSDGDKYPREKPFLTQKFDWVLLVILTLCFVQ